MRNSNILVSINENILASYYKKYPDFIIYNNCTTMNHWLEKTNPLGNTNFPKINEIPISIMNRYTEIPLYDEAVKYISKKK